MEDQSNSSDLRPSDVCEALRREFETIRRAVTCSICMSTFRDPVTLTSCVHAFCRGCITEAIRSKKQCPLCLATCTHRSLNSQPTLAGAVRCYKRAAQAFGLAPAAYDPQMPYLTQLPADEQTETEDMLTAHDELLAARTFAKHTKSNYTREEQINIVAVNQRHLVQAAIAGREPTLSQIHQESQNQYTADTFHTAPEDDELVQSEEGSLPSSPFAANCSPIQEIGQVETLVEAMERRTSMQSPSSIINNSPVVPKPTELKFGSMNQAPITQQKSVKPHEEDTVTTLCVEACEPQQEEDHHVDLDLKQAATDSNRDVAETVTEHYPSHLCANAREPVIEEWTPPSENVHQTACKALAASLPAPTEVDEEDVLKMSSIVVGHVQSPDSMEEEDCKPPFIEPVPHHGQDNVSTDRASSDDEHQSRERARLDTTGRETDLSESHSSSSQNLHVTTSNLTDPPDLLETPTSTSLSLGTIVEVQSRTWPGINQPGGVATVVGSREVQGQTVYDVQYVLDRRRERSVAAVYISVEETIDSASKGRKDSGSRSRRKGGCELPEELMAQLASQGFDVTGRETDKMIGARGERKKHTKKRKSNEKQSKVRKRVKSPRLEEPFVGPASFKTWTVAAKCKRADAHYLTLLSGAMSKGVVYVCSTGVSDEEQKRLTELSRIVKSTNVRLFVSEAIQEGKTSMCIVPKMATTSKKATTDCVAARRTMKTMQASLFGIPLVSSKWIDVCVEQRKIVLPESLFFIRSLPTKRKDTIADFGVAMLSARRPEKLFPANLSVFLNGFPQKKEVDFRSLLHDAGVEDVIVSKQTAIATAKALQEPYTFVVLCGDSSVSFSEAFSETVRKQRSRMVLVNAQWLVDSVSCGFVLGSCDYPPKGAKARALWEVTKMSSFG